MERDERFDELADAISEGMPVDPSSAGDDPATSSVVENLIALSKIQQLHRVPNAGQAVAAPDGSLWGHLRLLEKVGEGGYGEVHRAWDVELERQVALKMIRSERGEELADAVREEGRLLAKVDHPNVARVHGVAENAGRLGLWMEFVEGRTLHDVVKAGGPLEPDEVARIGGDLCSALAAIHAAGIVHGDVKAQNVMITDSGRVVLMDFGAGSRGASADGVTRGTPLYVAPETLAGEAPSPRADLYSLGVLLFHLLTGRFPLEVADVEELRAAHRAGTRRNVHDLRPDAPEKLASAIDRALATRPDDRPRTAAELGAALGAGPGSSTKDEPLLGRRHGLAWSLAAVVALVLYLVLRPPAPAGPLVNDSTLLRGSESFEPLASGQTVSAGDLLHLRLDVERACHVYVINRDDRGSRALLFPLPGYETQNPVGPGEVAIPGARTGEPSPVAWTLGEAGREHFLIVASEEPLAEFERMIAKLPPPERSAGALAHPLDEGALTDLYRGVTGVARIPATTSPEAPPADAVFDLAREIADDSGAGIWLREYVLPHQNP